MDLVRRESEGARTSAIRLRGAALAGVSRPEEACASLPSTARSSSKGSSSGGGAPGTLSRPPSRGSCRPEASPLSLGPVALSARSSSEGSACSHRKNDNLDGDSLDVLLSQAAAGPRRSC
mmetsp:Transcript_51479/g.130944  ORF Transcript_51479/g.130944 Transcript_51479/m.130944 type:complete len:120 (+) Transcript_51479:76-435(+)